LLLPNAFWGFVTHQIRLPRTALGELATLPETPSWWGADKLPSGLVLSAPAIIYQFNYWSGERCAA